jgi:ABC-type sugar transport system, permease component
MAAIKARANAIVGKTVLALFGTALALAVLVPVAYFVTLSCASNFEAYRFPAKLFPRLSYDATISYNADKDSYSLKLNEKEGVESLKTDRDPDSFRFYLLGQLNVRLSEKEMGDLLARAKAEGEVRVALRKSVLRNYEVFLILADGTFPALLVSLRAAAWTIAISLTLGGLSGYTLARMDFRMKGAINLGLLVVRMFPIVAISIPMVIYIMKMNLYDTPLSLAIVYSVPNIALTAWITNSIFRGISVELEEAAMVFGASRLRTFFSITAPLAFPALVASSLYAFLAAWNDTITALVMTNEHPTLAMVVYRTVGNSTIPNVPAAGAIVLLIPSLVFTFVIKNYINQMWGNVKI